MIVIENVRALPRATVNSSGRIVLADLSTTRAVTIRDLSVRGACLSADNWSDTPNVFDLLIRGRANAEPIRRTAPWAEWRMGTCPAIHVTGKSRPNSR